MDNDWRLMRNFYFQESVNTLIFNQSSTFGVDENNEDWV
ncbi:hypothetical protein J2Z40_000419 [Cytobacillus eiseniae]|uniref:Uncharacterized protein n=1 Tax=Cytobacillus eiseniae TaxID=762947 RepID=A0ABS4RAE0_9BACI|nr:hypothetical protein [Cytobacillus eiseniae]